MTSAPGAVSSDQADSRVSEARKEEETQDEGSCPQPHHGHRPGVLGLRARARGTESQRHPTRFPSRPGCRLVSAGSQPRPLSDGVSDGLDQSDKGGRVWSGLVWSGLVWSGLVWSGLVWSGLVWSGLVWWLAIGDGVDLTGEAGSF